MIEFYSEGFFRCPSLSENPTLAVLHAGQSSRKTRVFVGGELEMGIWGASTDLAGGLLLRDTGAEHEEA